MMTLFAAVMVLLASMAGASAAQRLDGAVVYGVIPQLLGPRGFADVADRLDAIAALGATVIWLSPITDAPPGDFGYAVTDLRRLRSGIGSEANLRDLIRGAHSRGLKVILDMPANDISDQHRFYRDALRRGRISPYWDFFDRDLTGAATHYFDWTNLENLNYGNPVLRRYVTNAFRHWLRDFDVDGFRLDAAWGPRQRTPDFWPQWVKAMRREKPDLLLLAEASERDPYYRDAGFDAAYDWTEKPGEWAWGGAFDATAPAQRLRAALAAEGDSGHIFRFLDNNDTGQRFISRHGIDMTRLAMVLLMTLPGLPCLYMGDEVGAEFEPYKGERSIDWSDSRHLRAYVGDLVRLRHAEPALHGPRMSLVATTHEDVVLAYLRPGSSAAETLLVLLNFSAAPVDIAFTRPDQLHGVADTRAMVDLLSEETLPLDREAPAITLASFTARILRRASTP